jgi:4-hydroxy-tetrahydrodipicolinate synthase
MNKFQGTGVALVTPFNTDGSVDYQGLERLINHQIAGGVDYLVSLGTTGETATLTKDEKKKVWEFTAEINNGRLPLMIGIGGNNTLSVAQEIKSFEHSGYDAVLSVSPYYNKPSQAGIYAHYQYLSEHSHLPILLYNVPGRTGSNMNADTICRLANDFDNIFGIKDACGNFDQFNQILRDKPKGFMLISGDDPVALPMISLGASGVISVVGNAFPKLVADFIRASLNGDFASAALIHLSLIEATRLCFVEGNPVGVKSALKQLGICNDVVRLPLIGASESLKNAMAAEIKKLV